MISQTHTQTTGMCLQCRQAARAFSTARIRQAIGPEHPRYIEVPEPPQQTSHKPQDPKGILPVPRPLFAGKRGIVERRDRSIELSTKTKQVEKPHDPNSFDGWKMRVAEQRKRNLREGTSELRRRHDRSNARRDQIAAARTQERQQAVAKPEREDERLTATSNNFDLASLMRGEVLDPNGEQEFQESQKRYSMREENKRLERLDHLHTLYTKATQFIVTPQQLDEALDTAFGTEEKPVLFGLENGYIADDAHSIWATGKPEDSSAMLARIKANKTRRYGAVGNEGKVQGGASIDQVAEALTGGAFGTQRAKEHLAPSELYAGLR